MSSFQGIQNTTAIDSKGNVNIQGDANIHINTTRFTPAAKKRRVWKLFCTVPSPTPYFAGREDLIEKIHHQIQQCSIETEYSKKIIVIHGLGGMGKSELVRKYVQKYLVQDLSIPNAAWIDAESRNSLEASFKSLAEELNLQTKGKKVKELVSSIYKHLSEHRQPSLFIFDNVQKMHSEHNVFGIFDFLPTAQLQTIPLIIITTRVHNCEIPENPENIIQINKLSEDAGIEFFTERWGLSPEQKHNKKIMNGLKNLAQNLQCFPLGLTLAVSNFKISKLRNIPKEIERYIKKLKGPDENRITERPLAGTDSEYDLIMNNVWAATLEKIQSKGSDGEAAISILNIIAYLPPEEIAVDKVKKVAKYCGLSTSIEDFEMLEEFSLISVPLGSNEESESKDERADSESSDSDDEIYRDIRIHRLVQRCTRDKLDSEKNYYHLIKISKFLARQQEHIFDPQTIHEHLKERLWPKKTIQFSLLFASHYLNSEYIFNIVKDVHEALVLKKNPCLEQNLTADHKILHNLNLFYASTYSPFYKERFENLISKDPAYSGDCLRKVFVSSLGKCVKGLFTGTMDTKDLVETASIKVLIRTFTKIGSLLPSSNEDRNAIYSMLDDATNNTFRGRVGTVGLLYSLLKIVFCFLNPISVRYYVELVCKIHRSVYASITEAGGDRLDSYWENDEPVPYFDILLELRYSINADRNSRIVESFRTEACLEFLLQHLQYLDTLTQTKIDNIPTNACRVLEFIMLLGWQWDCTKEFVQANLFMQTLYNITRNFFKLNANYLYKDQFRCLVVWFGLFVKNCCPIRNGGSWSIKSVETEMNLLRDNLNCAGRAEPFFRYTIWEGDAVLKEFLQTSGSDQESIAVKTATRMLEYLKSTIPHSISGL